LRLVPAALLSTAAAPNRPDLSSHSSPLKLRALRTRYVRLHDATFPETKSICDCATRSKVRFAQTTPQSRYFVR
jgi:hypothetical protein